MFAIAVKGYGIVIWEGGAWRTYTASDAMSALLSTRVEIALGELRPGEADGDDAACSALLGIAGAHLLAVDCDHGPDGCQDEPTPN